VEPLILAGQTRSTPDWAFRGYLTPFHLFQNQLSVTIVVLITNGPQKKTSTRLIRLILIKMLRENANVYIFANTYTLHNLKILVEICIGREE